MERIDVCTVYCVLIMSMYSCTNLDETTCSILRLYNVLKDSVGRINQYFLFGRYYFRGKRMNMKTFLCSFTCRYKDLSFIGHQTNGGFKYTLI